MNPQKKQQRRRRRHWRVRAKSVGTADRPRLCVRRSNTNIAAMVIDDTKGHTLLSVSSLSKELREKLAHGGNVAAAEAVGTRLAELARERGVSKVTFDRAGYKYHGRVKALAEAARAGGLKF